MSDTGIWKLKCSQCGEIFDLEIRGSESIVEASQNSRCPRCLLVPSAGQSPGVPIPHFHSVVGFHSVRKAL